MHRIILAGAMLMAANIATLPALAQDETPPPPCSSEEYRQLDFWVGNWNAAWTDAEGNEQTGSNVITRELGDCMIEESFDGNPGVPFVGRSISMYEQRRGYWKQVWMDSAGGFLDFSGGPDEGGFHFTLERPTEEVPYMRMIFRNIADDNFDWRWQSSSDEGETWDDQWVIHYTRAE